MRAGVGHEEAQKGAKTEKNPVLPLEGDAPSSPWGIDVCTSGYWGDKGMQFS